MTNNRHNYKYDLDLLRYINSVYRSDSNENIFGEYIQYLKGEGNVSKRTVQIYIKDLFGTYEPEITLFRSAEYTYFTFINRKNIEFKEQINREFIREYIAWLVENGIASASVNRRLSALRSLYKFLLIEGIVESSPIPVGTHQRKSPRSSLSIKMDKRLPVFLTQQEMEKLINAPDTDKPEGKRDRAITELLYASGMRISEIWQLDLKSIDLESREIRVLGKGSKERLVLMGIPAASALRDYIYRARVQLLTHGQSDALFLNNQGRRLSIRGIQKLLKHYSVANGIEKNVHPHVLRHTFATHMLDGGADLRVVQELLGHADLSSTQIYTHVTKQRARSVYLKSHPLAQEKDKLDGLQK
jgi:site-specific recombinase XerD